MRAAASLAAVVALAVALPARSDTAASGWKLEDRVTGLGPVTDLAFLPDGRALVTEKTGELKLRGKDGVVRVAARLDVDARSEKGLLGVAVDPDFAKTRRVFLYYSASDEGGGTDLDRHRVVSATLRDDGTLDVGAMRVLIRGLRGPRNHDGGGLAVGPDGMLYVGVGDTGCNSNAPPEPPRPPTNYFATCLSNANGKILRVALDGSIPDDNPLAAVDEATACGETCGTPIGSALAPPRREIWAWGLRNPWRFSFDPRTDRLWVGDVGEITYEEIDVVDRLRAYGWPWREGRHGWPPGVCRQVSPPSGDCVDPVYECRHGEARDGVDGDCQSITGGVFLPDAPPWPEALRGRYLFGDNTSGRIWTLTPNVSRDGVVAGSRREVARVTGMPVSFKVGPDGAVYVAVLPGRIVRIAPAK